MFIFLHRALKTAYILMLAGVAAYAYTKREALAPVGTVISLIPDQLSEKKTALTELSGTGLRVTGPLSFIFEDDQGGKSILALAAVKPPNAPANPSPAWVKKTGNTLREFTEGKKLQVKVYPSESEGVLYALVENQGTNLNALFLERDLVHLKREEIRGYPFKERFSLMSGLRKQERASEQSQ